MSRRPRQTPSAPVDEAGPPPDVRSSFGALFFFCLGALAMKVVGGALPPFFSSAFDLLIYAGIAVSVAIAYRRFLRRAIEGRRRERERQRGRDAR